MHPAALPSHSRRLEPLAALRRVTVETTDDGLAELAQAVELPGRRLAGEWRFARDAVLDWLANR